MIALTCNCGTGLILPTLIPGQHGYILCPTCCNEIHITIS